MAVAPRKERPVREKQRRSTHMRVTHLVNSGKKYRSATQQNATTEEDQAFEEYIQQLLEELESSSAIQNLLDEPLPTTAQLPEPLLPQPFCPRALPRQRQK